MFTAVLSPLTILHARTSSFFALLSCPDRPLPYSWYRIDALHIQFPLSDWKAHTVATPQLIYHD